MELVNTIDSKELYANRAVNDKNGNPIDTTYMDSNKLTIEDGKITEYNGTPFAGQGGMTTVHTAEPIIGDGSEENPVTANTLDVDYQQITHDDSLVHVSNNSQYALGVNIPVVANECIKFINGLTNLNTTGTAGANKGRVCHLNVTIPAGYKFGMWSQLATKGWVGSVYPEHPYLNDVDVWCPYAGTAFSTSNSIEWCCMVIKDGGN